ncbi:hypothetical protein ACFQI7_00395 [Paenibacillus allorhizosphaerae]|uniref:Extracellular solute-binding protein n=1 Tax=Paenibacillus allorhizosphaerae TaxID=2849866 RepID=A0ABM8V9Q9_9BACL|nr:hypothetical protein [Paenibacillus allorhizosphaerae]CAG7613994.1 hypothetical protein PAECIP111802_00034 [Paenibacillus allorhizosphaerae]
MVNTLKYGVTREKWFNSEFKKSYTEELGIFKGKPGRIIQGKACTAPVSTVFDNKIYAVLADAQKNMGQNGADVDKILRIADDQANHVFAEIKNAKK